MIRQLCSNDLTSLLPILRNGYVLIAGNEVPAWMLGNTILAVACFLRVIDLDLSTIRAMQP